MLNYYLHFPRIWDLAFRDIVSLKCLSHSTSVSQDMHVINLLVIKLLLTKKKQLCRVLQQVSWMHLKLSKFSIEHQETIYPFWFYGCTPFGGFPIKDVFLINSKFTKQGLQLLACLTKQNNFASVLIFLFLLSFWTFVTVLIPAPSFFCVLYVFWVWNAEISNESNLLVTKITCNLCFITILLKKFWHFICFIWIYWHKKLGHMCLWVFKIKETDKFFYTSPFSWTFRSLMLLNYLHYLFAQNDL